jgi:hypothetical protein
VVALPAGVILLILVGAIAAAILAITIIGIPVAILLIIAIALGIAGLVLALMVAVFLGFLNGAMFLGQRVLGRGSVRAQNPLIAILVGAALLTGLQVAGKLISVVGFVVFHPIAIALGIAAGALTAILTIAGFGAMVMTRFAAGPRGEGALGSQWWPSRRKGPAAEPAMAGTAAGGTDAATGGVGSTAPPADARPPGAPAEGGSSDAP